MVHETVTSLSGAEVLSRAKRFFAERIPMYAAYPEKEGPSYLVLRGQGGEEIAFGVFAQEGATRLRASTLLFDQQVARFISTLPSAATLDGGSASAAAVSAAAVGASATTTSEPAA